MRPDQRPATFGPVNDQWTSAPNKKLHAVFKLYAVSSRGALIITETKCSYF